MSRESKTKREPVARWHATGREMLRAMLEAIEEAEASVRVEMYIIKEGAVAQKYRAALVEAAKRGVRVRVMADAMGSSELADAYFAELVAAGGEFRRFNPLSITRMGLRNHRKVVVCDERVAFVGGINLAEEYDGDGKEAGWRDLGMELDGELAPALAREFDEMFGLADFRHKPFAWLRRAVRERAVKTKGATLLLSAPGWHTNPMIGALETDFAHAKKIQIMCPYFLPTWRLLGALKRAARRGCVVQLIMPAKTDVALMQMASHGLYRRLLKAGVEIHEYQPQILHAKLILMDEAVVYAGSANLDVRSLHLNYELLVRLDDKRLAGQAAAMLAEDLKHCRAIQLHEWVKVRTWWERIKSRVAHAIYARLDPYVARWQVKRLR